HRGAGGLGLGRRRAHRGFERLELLLADRLDLDEPARALELRARVLEARSRRCHAAPRLVAGGFERPRIDREEQLALLDGVAVGEVHVDEIARYARTHVDAGDGL